MQTRVSGEFQETHVTGLLIAVASLYPYGSSDVYLDNQYQGITEPVPVRDL